MRFHYLIILSVIHVVVLFEMKVPEKVIIDVDVGGDDYIAVLLLLNAEKSGDIKIEAIFCSSGNANLNNTCRNLMRLLTIVNRLDIPVYKGVKEDVSAHKEDLKYFYGNDGFGDLEYTEEPDLSQIHSTPSSVALKEFVSKYPNEINVICVGPLTNLGYFIQISDNDFLDKIKSIWLMGGNYGADKIEFNIQADVEAANILLQSVKKPVHMLTWQTSIRSQMSLDWRWEALGNETKALELLARMEEKVYAGRTYWMPCDAYAVFAFLNPDENILETKEARLQVVLDGPNKGLLQECDDDKSPNVIVIQKINVELFQSACLKLKNV